MLRFHCILHYFRHLPHTRRDVLHCHVLWSPRPVRTRQPLAPNDRARRPHFNMFVFLKSQFTADLLCKIIIELTSENFQRITTSITDVVTKSYFSKVSFIVILHSSFVVSRLEILKSQPTTNLLCKLTIELTFVNFYQCRTTFPSSVICAPTPLPM